MSDPHNDPRLSDPVMRRPGTSGGMWGWIAGIAVLVLIAIILIAGWNSNRKFMIAWMVATLFFNRCASY